MVSPEGLSKKLNESETSGYFQPYNSRVAERLGRRAQEFQRIVKVRLKAAPSK